MTSCVLYFPLDRKTARESQARIFFYWGDFRSSANRDRLCIPPLLFFNVPRRRRIELATLYLSQQSHQFMAVLRKHGSSSTWYVPQDATAEQSFLFKSVLSDPGWFIWALGELDIFYANEQRPQRWRCPPNRPHHLPVHVKKISARCIAEQFHSSFHIAW